MPVSIVLHPLLACWTSGAQSNAHVLSCLSAALSFGAQWQSFVRQQQEAPPTAPEHTPAAIAAPTSPLRSPPGPPLGLGAWSVDDESAGAPLALPDPGAPGAPDPGAAGPPGPGAQPATCLPLQARLPGAPDAGHSLAYLLQPVISLPLRPQLPAAPSAPHVGMGAGAGAWEQHEPEGFEAGPGSGLAAGTAAHAPARQQAQAVSMGAAGDMWPGYQGPGPAQVTGPHASTAAARQALMQRFREDSARLDARIRTARAPLQRPLQDPQAWPHAAGAPAGGRPSSTPPVCETAAAEAAALRASDQPPAGAPNAQPPAGLPSSQRSPAEGLGGWEAQRAGAAAAAAAGEAESSSMLDFLRQNLLAADAGDVEPQAAAREGAPRGGPQVAPGAAERADTSRRAEPMEGLGAGPRQGSGSGGAADEASGHVVLVAAQLRASMAAHNGDSAAATKRPRSPYQGGAAKAQGAAAKAPRLG